MDRVNFEELRKQIFQELNKIRTDPKSYVRNLEQYISYFRPQTNILAKPNEVPVQTEEGAEAFRNAIEFLRKQKSVSKLELNDNLNKAAIIHANDIGSKGSTSHEGSDGSSVSDRIDRYCEWTGLCAENLDFGTKDAVNIIINLLVDDGIQSRPHRRHIFSEKFNFVGIAAALHKQYETVVVLDYVEQVREKGTAFFDHDNYKIDSSDINSLKPKNSLMPEDPDAPEDAVSIKTSKINKSYKGRNVKVTKKVYSLQNGTTHIVEVEEDF